MANSLCALVQPSALGALSLGAKISPTPSSTVPSHDYHTPDKTYVDMKMDVVVDKGTVMVIDNEVIKKLEEIEVEVEVENSSNASRFFLPKKSHKEMTRNGADNVPTNHSTPPLNDLLTTLTTPERSNDQGAMIDRSTKRPREEFFPTPQSRKSLDQSVAHNSNPTQPATSATTANATSTSVCAPYVMTPDNLPSFLCNSIPTSKHFHAQVKSTFECLHCGFFREPKMVSSYPFFFLSTYLSIFFSSFVPPPPFTPSLYSLFIFYCHFAPPHFTVINSSPFLLMFCFSSIFSFLLFNSTLHFLTQVLLFILFL
jgi:hypothetical protein